MENELNDAKGRFKLAKKDVKDAKQKLNQALEEVVNKIENKKKEIKETQSNLVNDPEFSSAFCIENIKSKYDEAMVALELMKEVMFCLRTFICFVLKHLLTLFQNNYKIYKLI